MLFLCHKLNVLLMDLYEYCENIIRAERLFAIEAMNADNSLAAVYCMYETV